MKTIKPNKRTIFIARALLVSSLLQSCGGYSNITVQPKQLAELPLAQEGLTTRYNDQLQERDSSLAIALPPALGQGVTINGAAANDNSGYSISSAGDVNGDGKADILIGAPYGNPNGKYLAGSTYLLYGSDTLSQMINLPPAPGQGVTINGAAANDESGYSVSSAGDVNGDGKADILIGAHMSSPNGKSSAGSTYLLYGSDTLSQTINLPPALGQGITINGAAANDYSGGSVSSAGDVNGDGKADILIGAPYGNPNGKYLAGSTYLLYGSDTLSQTINLPPALGQGITINGAAANDYSGGSVSSAGDVNGDGKADILIGASGSSPNGKSSAGSTYLLYGSDTLSQTINLPPVLGQGITINGAAANDYSGGSVSSAGDVNGDGKADILIGASEADPDGKSSAGSTYLLYGNDTLSQTINLPLAPGQGVTINGANDNAHSSRSISSAGDVNGDGKADILIGAFATDLHGEDFAGSTYLLYGSDALSQTIDLPLAPGQGVTINGPVANANVLSSVSSAGDVNGDGKSDILIGARTGTYPEGSTYLLYGGANLNPSASPSSSPSTGSASRTGNIFSQVISWWQSYWQGAQSEDTLAHTDNKYVEQLLALQNNAQKMLETASEKTLDKWYSYSLEDVISDMQEALAQKDQLTKSTVYGFERHVSRIQRDFIKKPLNHNTPTVGLLSTYSSLERPFMQWESLLVGPAMLPGISTLPAIGN